MEGENKDVWSELFVQFCYLGNMIRGKLATSCDKSKKETEAEGVHYSSERQHCHVGQKAE